MGHGIFSVYTRECLYVCPEKLTHFQMMQKDEIWQTYGEAIKTKGKNPIPRKFGPGGSKVGDRKFGM
jgi:hypothetical protein